MTKSLHIVMGTSGQHEDTEVWVVAGYTDRRLAAEHQRLAAEVGGVLNVRYRDRMAKWDGDPDKAPRRGRNPYDTVGPKTGGDFNYYLVETVLRGAIPEAKRNAHRG
jgi:hypothetical protein